MGRGRVVKKLVCRGPTVNLEIEPSQFRQRGESNILLEEVL